MVLWYIIAVSKGGCHVALTCSFVEMRPGTTYSNRNKKRVRMEIIAKETSCFESKHQKTKNAADPNG